MTTINDNEAYKLIMDECKILATGDFPRVELPSCGICGHLKDMYVLEDMMGIADLVSACSFSWPLYSGNGAYPIPGGKDQYRDMTNAKWTGQQGLDRAALCAHIAKTLQKLLDEEVCIEKWVYQEERKRIRAC